LKSKQIFNFPFFLNTSTIGDNHVTVEDYDVDVRNIDKGVVDIRNNVVDKCCK
jgi:hypothetical protein